MGQWDPPWGIPSHPHCGDCVPQGRLGVSPIRTGNSSHHHPTHADQVPSPSSLEGRSLLPAACEDAFHIAVGPSGHYRQPPALCPEAPAASLRCDGVGSGTCGHGHRPVDRVTSLNGVDDQIAGCLKALRIDATRVSPVVSQLHHAQHGWAQAAVCYNLNRRRKTHR